jgi:predicted nucleic acid-binding protein
VIVADTNLLARIIITGETSPIAREVFKLDGDWRSPSIWKYEFLNLLSTSAKFGGLPQDQAQKIWLQASDWMRHRTEEPDASLALRLSIDLKISAYDALFVALARQHKTVLLTWDKALQKTAFPWAVTPEEFLKMKR